jgi:hypothetical protein
VLSSGARGEAARGDGERCARLLESGAFWPLRLRVSAAAHLQLSFTQGEALLAQRGSLCVAVEERLGLFCSLRRLWKRS